MNNSTQLFNFFGEKPKKHNTANNYFQNFLSPINPRREQLEEEEVRMREVVRKKGVEMGERLREGVKNLRFEEIENLIQREIVRLVRETERDPTMMEIEGEMKSEGEKIYRENFVIEEKKKVSSDVMSRI
jgi:hypothetical protein